MPGEKKNKPVQYLNKDFGGFREKLIDFAKNYFPDTYNDFNESSPGMMFIEMSAYVGDVLSYYVDHQAKESLLVHAEERENVIDMARALGYKAKAVTPAYVNLDVYQILPTVGTGGTASPDYDYALKFDPGMVIESEENSTIKYTTVVGCDFAASSSIDQTTVSVYTIDDQTGDPTSYLLKKHIKAVSGEEREETFNFASPVKFDKIRLNSKKVITIDSCTDSDGNRWYEVPYLAQDTIFEEIANDSINAPQSQAQRAEVPYLLKLRRTARRFTTGLAFNNKTELYFGAGISTDPDELIIPNPEIIGNSLDRGPKASLDVSFDPANMMFTKAYGQAPQNTTLTIKYLEGGGLTANVGSGVLNKINSVDYSMDEDGLDGDTLTTVKDSLAVTNPEPATGGRDEETVEEIRYNALGSYSTQNRAVTKEDYLARVYAMPPRFGGIAKAFMVQNDFVASDEVAESNPLALDLYVLTYNADKKLTNVNDITKQNLQQYLEQYRLLTDAINIRNGFIVNVGIDFELLPLPNYNGKEVLIRVIEKAKDYFNLDKWQFNQPIMVSTLSAEMDRVEGVQTISNLVVKNNVSIDSGYSGNVYDIEDATFNNIIYPSQDPMIFEVRYPEKRYKRENRRMIISIFPRKDATLYSAAISESVNTGIDEILEITKVISSSGTTQVTNTRILVDFDLDWISSSMQSGEISRSSATPMDFYLNLFATEAKNIPIEYHLAVAPVSESWDMGVGRSTNNPYIKEGASWKYRDGENTATQWNGNLSGGTTGSTFHSGSFVTKSYQETDDLRASVSKSVSIFFDGDKWLPGNQGFLVGRDPIEENNSKRYGSLLYFSNETKTIYKPKLEVCWDDSVFTTGSMSPLDVQNKDITLYVDNHRGTYYSGSRSRFRVRGIEKYRAKTYGTSSQALTVEYLPSSSYYSLIDSKTEESIISFDTKYTRVSCDSDGNFLDLWMEGLYPERLYELRFKVVSGSSINYYETNQPFKIIK